MNGFPVDEPVLRCDRLTRRFGERVAVNGLSLAVGPGETYGLLGPNGSGKTTAISMIAGILRPDAGSVSVCGRPMTTSSGDTKGLVGLVPQEIALYDDLTVPENLRFFGRLHGLGGAALEGRIADVLDVVGLTDRSRDRVEEYSGGMKRRANIAVGLLHEPRLLILDEPTVGVDPQSRNQILESIEVLGATGLAVLYTTHYMEEAERLCDRVGVLDRGELIAEGTRAELVAGVGEHDVITLRAAPESAEQLSVAVADIRSLDAVGAVSVDSDRVDIQTTDADSTLAQVVAAATRANLSITSLNVREPNLETVFLELTGRALRD